MQWAGKVAESIVQAIQVKKTKDDCSVGLDDNDVRGEIGSFFIK